MFIEMGIVTKDYCDLDGQKAHFCSYLGKASLKQQCAALTSLPSSSRRQCAALLLQIASKIVASLLIAGYMPDWREGTLFAAIGARRA